jgi:hypothetical protein
MFGRQADFCLGCEPYVPTKREILGVYGPTFFVVSGVLLLPIGGVPAGVGYVLLFFGVLGAGNILTVVIHEAGHASVARLVGLRVLTITIGSGPLMASRKLGALKLEARRFLTGGGATNIYDPSAKPAKWRMVLALLGGASANLAFVALGIYPFTLLPGGYHLDPTFVVVSYALLASQLLAAIMSLIPKRAALGQRQLVSDGKLVIGIIASKDYRRQMRTSGLFWEGASLLERRQYREAVQHYSAAWQSVPQSVVLLAALIDAVGTASGPRAALQCYLDHGQGLQLTDGEERGAIAAVFISTAWYAVLTGDRDQLALADQLSRQAVGVAPSVGIFVAIRGAVLLASRQEEGRQMLVEGMRKIEKREDKAAFAKFLAGTEPAQGADAGEWGHLAAFLVRARDGSDPSSL